jgi:hypothetical protein
MAAVNKEASEHVYLLYPLFQAEWDKCDDQYHQA